MFKIGDKVKIISVDSAPDECIGEIGTIEDIESPCIGNAHDNEKIEVRFDGDDWWYFSEENLELIKAKSTDVEFKIGDKVKIIVGYNEGLTGVIAHIDRAGNDGNFPYGVNLNEKAVQTYGHEENWSSGNSDICEKEHLELIKDFNIGDKVEIIDDNYNYSNKRVGYRFIIEEIIDGEWLRQKKGETSGVHKNSCRLVNNLSSDEFEIGKKVECISGDCKGITGTISKISDNYIYCNDWSDKEYGSLTKNELKLIDEGEEKVFYPYPPMAFDNSSMTLNGLNLNGMWIDEVFPAESKIKNMLQTIPRTLKRVLSPTLTKQYRAGLIDGDLKLTEEGRIEMLDILSQEKVVQEGLTKFAEEILEEQDKKKEK